MMLRNKKIRQDLSQLVDKNNIYVKEKVLHCEKMEIKLKNL